MIGANWGVTDDERALAFPCDGVLPITDGVYHRGISVRAPASVVFRWLCQLRVAPYSYDLLDNLGRRSPRVVTPGLDDLAVGQRVMTIFELVAFERDRSLALRLRRRSRIFGEIAMSYMIVPRTALDVRLLVRIHVQSPGPPVGPVLRLVLPLGDLVMMRKQLLTLRDLAERDFTSTQR